MLQRYEEQGDEKLLEYTRLLACVLPPRPGGTIGALEAAPDADVVICSHTGFEGAASLRRVWNGALLHRVIRVEFRRIPRNRTPAKREGQVFWLFDEWKCVDAWVESHAAT